MEEKSELVKAKRQKGKLFPKWPHQKSRQGLKHADEGLQVEKLVKAGPHAVKESQTEVIAKFVSKFIDRFVPAHRQERAFLIAYSLYPKSILTKINISIFILFPSSIIAFVKARRYIEGTKRNLMLRRREIEEEIRQDIQREKQNGTYKAWEEYNKNVDSARFFKMW